MSAFVQLLVSLLARAGISSRKRQRVRHAEWAASARAALMAASSAATSNRVMVN